MIKREEKAQQHFKKLKYFLLKQSPLLWKRDFKCYTNKFIEEHLNDKNIFTAILCKDEEAEEQDHIYLHRMQCLVAGAIQEWELVQQPKHAAICAKLDGALIWQDSGYVSPFCMLFPCPIIFSELI
jgi:hypothetical protein